MLEQKTGEERVGRQGFTLGIELYAGDACLGSFGDDFGCHIRMKLRRDVQCKRQSSTKVGRHFWLGGKRTKRDMRYLTLGSIASSSALYSKALATVVIGGVKFGFFCFAGSAG